MKIATTRQLFFTLVFLTTINFSFSQSTENCESLIQQELISKIQTYKPTELVPYYDDESKKWGFIHKKSKEILVQAIFRNYQIFNPSLTIYAGDIVHCTLNIKYSNGEYSFFRSKDEPLYPPNPVQILDAGNLVKDIPGFEVDEMGDIVAVNSMFFLFKDTTSNLGYLKLSNVFEYKNTHYGIVRNEDDSFSIYSDNGLIVDGFENLKSFPKIGNEYKDCNDFWILAKSDSGEYLFKSLTTKKSIEINCNAPKCWDCEGRIFFGYQILEVNGEIGLFDMASMKWKIKPDAQHKFSSIIYSSPIDIEKAKSISELKKNRKRAEIYLLTFDNKIIDINRRVIEAK